MEVRSLERKGVASPRELAELPYKGRSGEDEAVEEEASRSSSQRERKQGKSSREQSDCKGRGCLPTQLSERRTKGKSPGTTATPPHAETMSSASNQPNHPKTRRPHNLTLK